MPILFAECHPLPKPLIKQHQQHIVLRMKQLESKRVKVPNCAGQKCITNVLLTGHELSEVALTAWEPYHAEVDQLIVGRV